MARQKLAHVEVGPDETLLALIWDTIQIGMCITDDRGLVQKVNRAYQQLYGWSAAELIGQHFTQVLPLSVKDRATQIHETLIAGEWQLQCRNSEIRDVYVTTAPLNCPDGRRFQLITVVDITESKRVEIAFKQSETKFQKLAANLPGMVYQFLLSPDGLASFPYISPTASTVYELELGESLPDASILINRTHPEDRESFETSVALSAQTLASWNWEGRIITGTGRVKWVKGASRPERLANGSILWDGLLVDITQRKLAEAELLERSHLSSLTAEIGAILGQGGNLPAILKRCIDILVRHLEVVAAKIWTFNFDSQKPELQASIGDWEVECPLSPRLCPISPSPFPTYPLIVEDRLIGAIAIFSSNELTLAVHNTLSWVANAIAVAVDRLWAREELLSRRESLLFRLASQIRNSLDLNTILGTAVSEIRSLLNIDRCHFLWCWPHPEQPTLTITHESRLPNFPSLLGDYQTPQIGVMAEKIKHLETMRFNDLTTINQTLDSTQVDRLQVTLAQQGITSKLVLPLETRSGQLGAIVCIHYSGARPWSNSEVDLLRAVTDQLAIAIDQAELYTLTRTDALRAQAQAQELEQALHKLQQTQAQLVQTEKMSSLGQMVAGVAHEINNPVNFISGNISHASNYIQDLLGLLKLYQHYYPQPAAEIQQEAEDIDLEFLSDDLPNLLDSMKIGADRISQIVRSLRNFSRLDEAEKKPVNINEGIDNTLLILQHRIKPKGDCCGTQIIKDYAPLPPVDCYAGQLNQVFMNVLSNALDSLEEAFHSGEQPTPTIRISTRLTAEYCIVIQISDNGIGMTESVRKRLFDPFFTTKSVGKGTGLGLSISYQIVVDKHGGSLDCISEPGKGAEFTIQIPVAPSCFNLNLQE